MDHKWVKISCWTFNSCFSALDQVQYVYCAASIVRSYVRKPASAGLDELEFVKSGAFFLPPLAGCHRLYAVN